jgi:hypothetical protein
MSRLRVCICALCAITSVAGLFLAANGPPWLVVLSAIPAALPAIVIAYGPEIARHLRPRGRWDGCFRAALMTASAVSSLMLYVVALGAAVIGGHGASLVAQFAGPDADSARSILVLLLSSVLFFVNLSLGAFPIGDVEIPPSLAKLDSPASGEPQGEPQVKGASRSEQRSASASQTEHEAETLRSKATGCVEYGNTEPGNVASPETSVFDTPLQTNSQTQHSIAKDCVLAAGRQRERELGHTDPVASASSVRRAKQARGGSQAKAGRTARAPGQDQSTPTARPPDPASYYNEPGWSDSNLDDQCDARACMPQSNSSSAAAPVSRAEDVGDNGVPRQDAGPPSNCGGMYVHGNKGSGDSEDRWRGVGRFARVPSIVHVAIFCLMLFGAWALQPKLPSCRGSPPIAGAYVPAPGQPSLPAAEALAQAAVVAAGREGRSKAASRDARASSSDRTFVRARR